MQHCPECKRDLPPLFFSSLETLLCKECQPLLLPEGSSVTVTYDGTKKNIVVRKAPFPEMATDVPLGDGEMLFWKPNLHISSLYQLSRDDQIRFFKLVKDVNPENPVFFSGPCNMWIGPTKGAEDNLHVLSSFRTSQGKDIIPYIYTKCHVEDRPKEGGPYHCGHLCKQLTGVHSRGLCVNPLHLQWQTPTENSQMRVEDGHITISHHYGEAHGMNKYPTEHIIGAVEDLKQGMTIGDTADKWNMSFYAIADLSRGRSWKHLTGGPGRPSRAQLPREAYVAETFHHEQRPLNAIVAPLLELKEVPTSKLCGGCHEEHPIDMFYERGGGVYSDKCRPCHALTVSEGLQRRTEEGKVKGFIVCNGSTCKGKAHPPEQFNYKNKAKGILRLTCKECQRVENAKARKQLKQQKHDPAITEKVCSKCGFTKSLDHFYQRPHGAYDPMCGKCQSERVMALKKVRNAARKAERVKVQEEKRVTKKAKVK